MALPQGFIDFTAKHPLLSDLPMALLTEPEVSVRLNLIKLPEYTSPTKSNAELASAERRRKIDDTSRVKWCRSGFYLPTRPQFTFDPKFHQGLYYVQDASSMAIDAVIRHLTSDGAKVRYLDVCAAPGGKTTAALAALPEGSVVVANEYDYRRAEILAENLSKWGNPNVLVCRGDTSRLRKLRGEFDIVAVDAPCSGEGMMRKDAQAVDQWSPALIRQCASTQKDIVMNAWEALRPGGYLIYSTCTFNTEENEENLHWLINQTGAEAVEIPELSSIEEVATGIGSPYPCYRFIPGRVRGEGLFMAVVKKPGSSHYLPSGKTKQGKPSDIKKVVEKWFTSDIDVLVDGEEVYALPVANAAFLRHAASLLDPVMVGVHAASIKGHDVNPTHELSLSTAFNPEAFPAFEADYPTAVKYLRRDAVCLSSEAPRGYVLLTYEGRSLGIVKNIGNRTNSTLPKAWRIISQSVPDDEPCVI